MRVKRVKRKNAGRPPTSTVDKSLPCLDRRTEEIVWFTKLPFASVWEFVTSQVQWATIPIQSSSQCRQIPLLLSTSVERWWKNTATIVQIMVSCCVLSIHVLDCSAIYSEYTFCTHTPSWIFLKKDKVFDLLISLFCRNVFNFSCVGWRLFVSLFLMIVDVTQEKEKTTWLLWWRPIARRPFNVRRKRPRSAGGRRNGLDPVSLPPPLMVCIWFIGDCCCHILKVISCMCRALPTDGRVFGARGLRLGSNLCQHLDWCRIRRQGNCY